jgi:SPP1 gp7 family putative phage head morphogenesis protein
MGAVALQAEMDQNALSYNWGYFRNNAEPGGVLSTGEVVTPDNKKRLLEQWNNNYKGKNNSYKTAVLDRGLKYDQIKSNTQKEMDFVESRRFTRDEVLAIFKVPKAIIGVTDDVNRATAQVANSTFRSVCVNPLAMVLQRAINTEILAGDGYFAFVNVVPEDSEQSLVAYNSGAITTNEYRAAIGFDPITGGDETKTMITQEPVEEEKEKKDFSKMIKKHIKGTKENFEERGQKIWEKKIQRTNAYEVKYEQEVLKVFETQKQAVVGAIMKQSKTKDVEVPDQDKFSTAKWVLALTAVYKEVYQSEANEALTQIGILQMYDMKPASSKWIKDNIKKMAIGVDKTTKKIISETVASGNSRGLGAEAIAKEVSGKFDDFAINRARKIARTEITRASNAAAQAAWTDSGLVKEKQWFTSLDERVSDICKPLHGKVIKLNEDYIQQGETWEGVKMDYEDVSAPPAHVNCRCTLLPVAE